MLCLAALTIAWTCLVASVGETCTAPQSPTLTKAPELIHFEAAKPPANASEIPELHVVVLTLDIDAQGAVTRAEVTTSGGTDFDTAAITAANKLRFSPAEIDGHASAVQIAFRYEFPPTLPPPTPHPLASPHEPQAVPAIPVKSDAEPKKADGLKSGNQRAAPPSPKPVAKPKVSTKKVDDEAVVVARRVHAETRAFQISARESGRLAGTQGDPLQVVLALPGVARPALGSDAFVLWGAMPNESRVYLDGVEIPALYHLGGLRSILAAELVADVVVVPGGYGPAHGRALGGLVEVSSAPIAAKPFSGQLAVDLFDAAVLVQSALHRKVRIAVSGRQSLIYGLLGHVFGKRGTQWREIFPLPRYRDAAFKLTVDLRPHETLSMVVVGADDARERQIPAEDPALRRGDASERSFLRTYLIYQRDHAQGARLKVTPYFGLDRRELQSWYGSQATRVAQSRALYGLRSLYRAALGHGFELAFGTDIQGLHANLHRIGSLTVPSREGDFNVFGRPPGVDLSVDQWKVDRVDAALYAELAWSRGAWQLKPGLRIDAYSIVTSRLLPKIGATPPRGGETFPIGFDPRFAWRVRIAPRLHVDANVGRYHQPPDVEDLSAVFGNPRLGLAASTQISAGMTLDLGDLLETQVSGYRQWLNDLSVRNSAATPPLARALTQNGEGRSYGAQVLLRQRDWHGLRGWIAYTIGRSERRRGKEPWRLSDFDQTHGLTVVASWSCGPLTLGTRARWMTGMPRTPIRDAYYDIQSGHYQPIFGAHNRIRLGDFWQLDARVDYTWTFGRTTFDTYLDLQNLTNHKNTEELAYNFNYSQARPIYGLPIFAMLGFKFAL